MSFTVRQHDWSSSPLGPLENWSLPLRTLLGVMQGSNQPMFVAWGPARTLIYNDAYAPILGRKHPAAMGQPFLEVWSEIRDDLSPIVEQAYSGQPVQMDDLTLVIDRNGYREETHFAFSYTPVRGESGAIEGFFCVCQEITGQVVAERHLRESEARAREDAERVQLALDAGAIIGTWTWDLPADRFTADERFARSVGLDPEECRAGLSIDQVVRTVHPEDRPGLMGSLREVIARGGPYARQYRVLRTDGRYHWIEAKGRVDQGSDGTPLRFPGVLLDSAARRAAEVERDRARRLLESFVEAVPGVAYAKDREGRLLVANRGVLDLVGKPTEAILGRTDAEFLEDPDQAAAVMDTDRRIMESGLAEQVEERISLPDGSSAVWLSTKAPLRDARGTVVGLIGSSIDITARKEVEAALSESEERFRNMADHAPVMMWVTDPDGACTYLNRVWYDFTGQTPEDALGMGWLEATHPDDRAEAERIFRFANQKRVPFRIDYRLRRADRQYRWAIDAAAPRFGSGGEFLGFIGSVIDITDRKEVEEALRARTAEIESLLSSAPLGVAFFDREHRWIRINDELAAINGFSITAHIGRRIEDLLPLNARFVKPMLDRVLASGEPIRNVEVTGEVPHMPGVPRHWLVNYDPVRDSQGQVSAVGTWVVDITERKEAEARLRALTDTLPAFVWFSGPDGAVLSLNERWYDYTGQTREEALSHGWSDIVHPEDRDRVITRWREALAAHRTYEVEMRYRRRDGAFRWHVARAVPLRDASGVVRGWVGTSSDIDDRVRAEEALRALNDTLESRIDDAIARREQAEDALRQSQKMEAVGQLTGGIAHDFNNMLAAVVGSLDLLSRRIGEEDARARRYVDAAMEGARRAAALTQRLLAFSRQQPLRPESVNANRLVQGMSDLLRRSLGPTIRLETSLARGIWKAFADPNQLENVILNLALNARDAMPQGGQLLIATSNSEMPTDVAGQAGLEAGDYVRISVGDTGTGMSQEVAARAFDPFFTTKPVGQGTGLGLSQVYGFIRQSDGHVEIESVEGQGTTVRLYLPRHKGPEVEDEPEDARAEPPRGSSGEVILVVEDEDVVRRFTVEALSSLGYSVIEAQDGTTALRLLDEHPEVTLLLSDIVMPGLDGRQVAEEARRRRPGLRVLFVTGYMRDDKRRDGSTGLKAPILSKPFSVDALAVKLREVLEEGWPVHGMAGVDS